MPNDNILRRSNRQHVPTTRARFYNKQREVTRPLFPSVGDDIAVKWLLNKRSIWWPATILSVENNSSTRKKVADILYHKYEDYAPVKVHVYFTASSSGQRFVISHGCNDSSSWVFSDECSSSDGESIDEVRESSPKRSSKHIFKKGKRESSEGTSTQLEKNGKRALSDPPNSNIVKKDYLQDREVQVLRTMAGPYIHSTTKKRRMYQTAIKLTVRSRKTQILVFGFNFLSANCKTVLCHAAHL